MNRQEMRTDFYDKISEASTNSTFGASFVNRLLQEGWQAVWSYRNTAWDWLRKDVTLEGAFTSIISNEDSLTITVDDAGSIYENQKIYVTDNSIFEEAEVESIDESEITLVAPGLAGSYENGDLVIGRSIELPTDFRNILSVRAENISGTIQTTVRLTKANEYDLDRLYPRIMSKGIPEFYYVAGNDLFIYPLPDSVWRFQVKYTAKPADLSDAESPPLPVEYHYLIVDYAVSKALSSDLRTKSNNTARVAAYYAGSFTSGIQDLLFNNSLKPDNRIKWTEQADTGMSSFS